AFAMKILVNLGDLEDASRLVPIVSAHISGVSYHTAGEALIRLLEELTGMSATVSVPTSLNPAGMDLALWKDIGFPDDFAEKQLRIIDLYSKLGIDLTCSCIPYEIPRRVQAIGMGDHLAWSESNAVIYANSMVGARTNRESGISALAAAILGKTPLWGMHLDGPRMPTLEVKMEGTMEAHHYDLLGVYIGSDHNSDVVVFKGMPPDADTGSIKHLGAAMAAKGGHAIFHVDGITPEQDLVKRAREARTIEEKLTLTTRELERRKDELYPPPGDGIDTFVLGCPHFDLSEFQRLKGLLSGRKLRKGKRLIIFTSRSIIELLDRQIFRSLVGSGVEIYADTCMVVAPLRSIGIDSVGTDSGKAAHYIPRMSGVETRLLPLDMIIELCVD
ncbi:MAG: aconitase X, partial [Thermoplasmatota archaeon]